MNDRIKKLCEQSKLYADNCTKDFTGDEPVVWMDYYTEKFAELIVKECASICELNGQSYKHSFTPAKAKLAESTSVYCGTLIKKHFGVE